MRRAVSRALAGALAAGLAGGGCAAPPTGEIMLAIDTDVAPPTDLDALRIRVSVAGVTRADVNVGGFGENPSVLLPATFGVVVSDTPSEQVTMRVTALSHGDAVIDHEITAAVPEDRVAMLRMPLHFLCRAVTADELENGVCPPGQTCVSGACVSGAIDASALPDYSEEAIFGAGTCLDVGRCFAGAATAEIDEACTVAAEGDVNVALETEGEGICGAAGCFVALEAESALGWTRAEGGRIQLPAAVCNPDRRAGVRVVTAPASAGCPRKTASVPTCGSWSTAGGGGVEPTPVVIAGAQEAPVELALGEDEVVWVNQGSEGNSDGAVKRVAAEGGAPVTLADGQSSPRGVALDGARVLWTARGADPTEGAIRAWDSVGGVVDLATLRLRPEGISVSRDTALWTEYGSGIGDGSVSFKTFKGTLSEVQSLPEAQQGAPYQIAAAKDRVCWSDHHRRKVICMNLDARGTPVGEETAVGEDEPGPQAVALDVDAQGKVLAVYWANLGDRGGEIVRAEIDVAGSRAVLASGQAFPTGIAVDKEHVYWTSRSEGKVLRVPKGGGSPPLDPELVAEGQRNPGAIAAGLGTIFWVNEGERGARNGAIVRLAR